MAISKRGHRVGGVISVVLFSLLWVPAWAQGGEDFSTFSEEWNGLKDFVDLARESGVELLETERLLWGEVGNDDALVVIYPQVEMDTQSFAAFLVDGGRVLLADDFGASPAFLERLSLVRSEPAPADLPHENFVDAHPGWPIITVRGRHPLLEGVERVVGNYPSVLYNIGGPVLSYDQEGGFLYDMMLGEGRAVVFADPGVFLNGMLKVADNRRLAENSLQYLCEGREGCRIWLMVGDASTEGVYGGSGDSSLSGEELRGQVESLNQRLRDAFRELPRTGLLSFLAVFLVFGSTAYLLTVFPWRRLKALSEYIGRRERECAPPLTEFDWNLARYGEERSKISHLLPMAILKEVFLETLSSQSGVSCELLRGRPERLKREMETRALRGVGPEEEKSRRARIEALVEKLAPIPGRQEVFMGGEGRCSRGELMSLHREIVKAVEWMGIQEKYERRTGEADLSRSRSRRGTKGN